MLSQAHPHQQCQSRGLQRICRNPRCSLRCYKAWGHKECVVLDSYLKSLPEGQSVYVGTLTVQADLSVEQHQAARRLFCRSLRTRFGSAVQFHAVMEISEDRRPHSHYVMTADGVSVSHDDVKSAWSAACPGLPTRVQHEPPRDVTAWCRYIFADCKKFIRLPAKGGLQITWGSRGFYGAGVKAKLWAAHIEATFPTESCQPRGRLRLVRPSDLPAPSASATVDAGSVVTPTASPVAGRRSSVAGRPAVREAVLGGLRPLPDAVPPRPPRPSAFSPSWPRIPTTTTGTDSSLGCPRPNAVLCWGCSQDGNVLYRKGHDFQVTPGHDFQVTPGPIS
jgi:hypothetical protein